MSCSFFYQSTTSSCSLCSIPFLPPPATFSPLLTLQITNFCPNIILLHPLTSVSEAGCNIFTDRDIWDKLLLCEAAWPFVLTSMLPLSTRTPNLHTWGEPCRALLALTEWWGSHKSSERLSRMNCIFGATWTVILIPYTDLWEGLSRLGFMAGNFIWIMQTFLKVSYKTLLS